MTPKTATLLAAALVLAALPLLPTAAAVYGCPGSYTEIPGTPGYGICHWTESQGSGPNTQYRDCVQPFIGSHTAAICTPWHA